MQIQSVRELISQLRPHTLANKRVEHGRTRAHYKWNPNPALHASKTHQSFGIEQVEKTAKVHFSFLSPSSTLFVSKGLWLDIYLLFFFFWDKSIYIYIYTHTHTQVFINVVLFLMYIYFCQSVGYLRVDNCDVNCITHPSPCLPQCLEALLSCKTSSTLLESC